MPRKLKVYRTAIGFHDAYVAAPSQQAALKAWGTDKPLFARGAAELVTDAALTAEPLAAPGTVIKRLRGSAAEQVAALPPDRPKTTATGKAAPSRKATRSKAPPTPRPSRAALGRAETALSEAEARCDAAHRDLVARERALVAERKQLERDQKRELERLTRARDTEADSYQTAVRRWQL